MLFFASQGEKSIQSVFSEGVYLGKNTSRPASVRASPASECARQGAAPLSAKPFGFVDSLSGAADPAPQSAFVFVRPESRENRGSRGTGTPGFRGNGGTRPGPAASPRRAVRGLRKPPTKMCSTSAVLAHTQILAAIPYQWVVLGYSLGMEAGKILRFK